ncbi:MAG TPA: electron transfer flavoprotein subunit alpha/FixB family protein [Chitinophagales bacterium]|nr:electron transfer flavoprotein subunit alpha/FixB family protein [Chitinophagales bacterium]
MSVLVFCELTTGRLAKPAFEAVTYGRKIADKLGTDCQAVVLEDAADAEQLGQYGAETIHKNTDARLHKFEPNAITKALENLMKQTNAQTLVLSFGYTAKAIGPVLAARLKAGYVPGAIALPNISGAEWDVKKNVFSGKAFAHYMIHTPVKVIALLPNSIPIEKAERTARVVDFNPNIAETDFRIQSVSVQKAEGTLSLSDAELVVSGGRGLKGPENWKMLEEMADLLGAATACSRAVADVHWRPHSEHVGQTGLAIRPNLYIAIGISGAIQHLAGVNGSKVIVVINKDAEAPFFKAADYGIVGDAFDVVPKLNEALRKFKAANN